MDIVPSWDLLQTTSSLSNITLPCKQKGKIKAENQNCVRNRKTISIFQKQTPATAKRIMLVLSMRWFSLVSSYPREDGGTLKEQSQEGHHLCHSINVPVFVIIMNHENCDNSLQIDNSAFCITICFACFPCQGHL